jgi:hypothetical protein
MSGSRNGCTVTAISTTAAPSTQQPRAVPVRACVCVVAGAAVATWLIVEFVALPPADEEGALAVVVLAIVGVVVVCMRRSRYASLRALALGALLCVFAAISLPFVDHRYLSDFVPLLVVLGGAGTYAVVGWYEAGRRVTTARVAIAAGLAVLAVFSVLANVALAVVYQRAYAPFTSEPDRAAFVRFQRAAPGGSHMPVRRGDALPRQAAPAGTLFVVGDCVAVFWSDGADWHPVERTQASGLFPMDITPATRAAGTRETLLIAGPPGAEDHIVLEYTGPRRVRFVLSSDRLPQPAVGPVQHVPANGTLHVNVLYDAPRGQTGVSIGNDSVLGLALPLASEPVRVAGRDFALPDVRLLPAPARFCAELTNSPRSTR